MNLDRWQIQESTSGALFWVTRDGVGFCTASTRERAELILMAIRSFCGNADISDIRRLEKA